MANVPDRKRGRARRGDVVVQGVVGGRNMEGHDCAWSHVDVKLERQCIEAVAYDYFNRDSTGCCIFNDF